MNARLGTRGESSDDLHNMLQDRNECMLLIKQAHVALKDNNTTSDRQVRKKLSKDLDEEMKKFQTMCQVMEEKERMIQLALQEETKTQINEKTPLTSGPSSSSYQQKQVVVDADYLRYHYQDVAARHSKLIQIERDTQEVLEIWKDLKTIVEEHQPNLDVIENNIIDMRGRTNGGLTELLDAEANQKKSRKRRCYLLGLALLFAVVVVALFFVLNFNVFTN